jgi:hypothetical protein
VPVLRRALVAVCADANGFWMLYQGMLGVAFHRKHDDRGCRPPYACHCYRYSNDVAAAAIVAVTVTLSVSTTGASATANDTTTACQAGRVLEPTRDFFVIITSCVH